MNQSNKFCIVFAGAVGSSKTPIAHYISLKLGLPILNNDVIRTEVLEDLGEFNQDEFIVRRDSRAQQALMEGMSFIYDGSIDREWPKLKSLLADHGYEWCVISLDLSRDFLAELYKTKGYLESLEKVDQLVEEHNRFVTEYKDDIVGSISTADFPNRLEVGLNIVRKWLDGKN